MLGLFGKLKELENRVQEIEIRLITNNLKLKVLQEILYRHYTEENSNGNDKNGKIKTKKSPSKRDNCQTV